MGQQQQESQATTTAGGGKKAAGIKRHSLIKQQAFRSTNEALKKSTKEERKMGMFSRFWGKTGDDDESSGDEVEDPSAQGLSHIGRAAYDELRKHHNHHHHELWNVTKSRVVGNIHVTPQDAFDRHSNLHDPKPHHDDWFPKKLGEIISRTEEWCDILSLEGPDGLFLEEFKKALATICQRKLDEPTATLTGSGLKAGKVTIRCMFGNILGTPTDCNRVIAELTADLPDNAPILLWVGSWRKGASWNHSKIIAVDGKYLWTGGHNLYTGHYLIEDPVLDVSLELQGGGAARDGHRYANAQWGYIVKKQQTLWGQFVDGYVPDSYDVPRMARVTVSEYPARRKGGSEYPPKYKYSAPLLRAKQMARTQENLVPVITMGRYGVLLKKARPSDDAFVAMIEASETIIRLSCQDLGPVCIPGTKMPLPGTEWPERYLNALARVLWLKGVDIEIVLSNPNSVPGPINTTDRSAYGNGWTCVDCAAEIIKRIKTQFPDAKDGDLRKMVQENLRICYLRCPAGKFYKDGKTLGLHTKHYIFDDVCCYIGSQNLYVCDLAEWGVVIDDPGQVSSIMDQLWRPMWKTSFKLDDCDVDLVMDGLEIDRSAPPTITDVQQKLVDASPRQMGSPGGCLRGLNKKGDDSSSSSEGED